MKSFLAAVGLFVGLSAAQTTLYNYQYPAIVPQCGKDCFNNMLFDAPNYGCKPTTDNGPNAGADLTCLCANGNWNQNFNNCVNQHCGDPPPYPGIDSNHTGDALSFIASVCKQGISTTASVFTTTGVDSASSSYTSTVTAVGAGPVIFTVTSGGSTFTSTISGVGTTSTGGAAVTTTTASQSAADNSTAVVVTTTDSAGNTTLSTVTGSAINGTTTGAAGNGTLVGGGVITTTNSAGSTITSTESSSSGSGTSTETSVSSSTETATATSSGGSGGSGSSSAAPASSSKAAGGHFAAPGFAGVAGLAAFAFL